MANLRPFQLILLAVFGLLALVGLFVFANFSGFGGGKNAVGPVVIWGTLPKDAVDAGLSALSSAQSQYAKVTYVERPAASFDSDLANALASGTGPDLVIISQEMLEPQMSKLRVIPFSSVPQRTYIDTYLPEFELFLSADGTYGLPLALDPLVLYYNRAILASAGVASPPATWEAVAGLSSALTKRTDAGAVTRSFIPLGEYDNVDNARAVLSALLLQAGTPITKEGPQGLSSALSDQDSSFGTTPAQSAVNFYAQFADPAKTLYSWNRSLPDSRTDFISGDLALYPGFASEQPFLASANPNLDYDMARLPAPGTLANRITYGDAYALAITKASANPAGAYAAAAALTAKGSAEAIAHALSMAPARRASLSAAADDKYGAVYYPEALIAEGWLSPGPSATDGIFSAMISDITSGRKSVEQALAAASNSITASLR